MQEKNKEFLRKLEESISSGKVDPNNIDVFGTKYGNGAFVIGKNLMTGIGGYLRFIELINEKTKDEINLLNNQQVNENK